MGSRHGAAGPDVRDAALRHRVRRVSCEKRGDAGARPRDGSDARGDGPDAPGRPAARHEHARPRRFDARRGRFDARRWHDSRAHGPYHDGRRCGRRRRRRRWRSGGRGRGRRADARGADGVEHADDGVSRRVSDAPAHAHPRRDALRRPVAARRRSRRTRPSAAVLAGEGRAKHSQMRPAGRPPLRAVLSPFACSSPASPPLSPLFARSVLVAPLLCPPPPSYSYPLRFFASGRSRWRSGRFAQEFFVPVFVVCSATPSDLGLGEGPAGRAT